MANFNVKLRNKTTNEVVDDEFYMEDTSAVSLEVLSIIKEEYGDGWELVEIGSANNSDSPENSP